MSISDVPFAYQSNRMRAILHMAVLTVMSTASLVDKQYLDVKVTRELECHACHAVVHQLGKKISYEVGTLENRLPVS